MRGSIECQWCHGRIDVRSNLQVHLDTCPGYDRKEDPWADLTIDDVLEHLGSKFRVGR